VLKWLQDTAPALSAKQYAKGEWRYTQSDRLEERSRKIGGNMKTTTMMDVDDGRYPQKRKVQHQTTEFNRRLTKSLFDFVRRGQIKEAIKMCDLCDEPGQSAGLYGFLVHNKCLSDTDGNLNLKRLTSTEATARNLWETSCRQIARDNSLDVYERATYAALCGDMENTLPACTTWEDLVWAYYNASVENLLSEIIMPDYAGSNVLPPEETIFSSAQRKDVNSDAYVIHLLPIIISA
jgi:nuclear pore complex protein Nup107